MITHEMEVEIKSLIREIKRLEETLEVTESESRMYYKTDDSRKKLRDEAASLREKIDRKLKILDMLTRD